MVIETVEEREIIDAMRTYGGSFVKCLAECFEHADVVNTEKLKKSFPEYWEEYRKMSKMRGD